MIVVSLDSLAICVLVGVILAFLSPLLFLLSIQNFVPITLLIISLILIIVPSVILTESSYIYPRMKYGYFANVNNALRFTHSLNRPLVLENFTNITNKKRPNMVIEPTNDNQLNYTATKPLSMILRPFLPSPLDLDEHRFAKHYHPSIISKRRRQLNRAFNKHYEIDPKILDKAKKFDHLFQKGAIGAHVRFAGHYINKTIDFDKQIKSYTDYIDKTNHYYVYLATHLKEVEDIFKGRYGSRLIISDHYRNPNKDSDWVSNNLTQPNEDTNVLIDMILLSKCKEIIGGPSNVFYACLWYNPDLKFHVPDIFKNVVSG